MPRYTPSPLDRGDEELHLGEVYDLPEHIADWTFTMQGRPLSGHRCSGRYRKRGDECYECLDCGALCQIPNPEQIAEEQAN